MAARTGEVDPNGPLEDLVIAFTGEAKDKARGCLNALFVCSFFRFEFLDFCHFGTPISASALIPLSLGCSQDGNNIWGEDCLSCGMQIQNGNVV